MAPGAGIFEYRGGTRLQHPPGTPLSLGVAFGKHFVYQEENRSHKFPSIAFYFFPTLLQLVQPPFTAVVAFLHTWLFCFLSCFGLVEGVLNHSLAIALLLMDPRTDLSGLR